MEPNAVMTTMGIMEVSLKKQCVNKIRIQTQQHWQISKTLRHQDTPKLQ